MIRAYHDPALRHPISRDDTWGQALEFVCARSSATTRRVYLHNPSAATLLLGLSASASGFVVTVPPSVNCPPGVTSFDVTVLAGSLPLPTVKDFVITATVDTSHFNSDGYSGAVYSDLDYVLEMGTLGGANVAIEATAFCLPVGDERFNDLNPGPLQAARDYTEYIASGMGFVDDDYKQIIVGFMAEHLRDWGVWALNKHYMFTKGPMRHARARADSIGYNPPGVPALPPEMRRNVYANAYDIARKTGSADGIRAIFEALGIPQTQLNVWREGFTWFVRIPQWIASRFNIDFLGNLALYHVDPYCTVNIAVNESTIDREYSDLDYTVEPGLTMDAETVTYGGADVTYGGEEVTYP